MDNNENNLEKTVTLDQINEEENNTSEPEVAETTTPNEETPNEENSNTIEENQTAKATETSNVSIETPAGDPGNIPPVEEKPKKSKKGIIIILIIVILAIGAGISCYVYFSNNSVEMETKEDEEEVLPTDESSSTTVEKKSHDELGTIVNTYSYEEEVNGTKHTITYDYYELSGKVTDWDAEYNDEEATPTTDGYIYTLVVTSDNNDLTSVIVDEDTKQQSFENKQYHEIINDTETTDGYVVLYLPEYKELYPLGPLTISAISIYTFAGTLLKEIPNNGYTGVGQVWDTDSTSELYEKDDHALIAKYKALINIVKNRVYYVGEITCDNSAETTSAMKKYVEITNGKAVENNVGTMTLSGAGGIAC